MDTFSDLPDALVRDLLAKAIPVAQNVESRLRALRSRKDSLRDAARNKGLVRRKADLDVPREPSVAGIDGSYQIHRLTSLDLCAAAAVAVQGTVKEERNKHWPEPYHRIWVEGIPHDEDTTGLLRATMVSMELELAALAPHDVVLLDGSFASLVIYVNQGLNSISSSGVAQLREELTRRWNHGPLFAQIIRALTTDRIAAVPKYTSRTELAQNVAPDLQQDVDDKTLATLMLDPGEYTTPLPMAHGEPYHLSQKYCTKEENAQLDNAMRDVRVLYFRPYGWLPALRLELPGSSANSQTRLSIVLEGIQRQFFSPAVIEPYPLFLADRMVKSLGAGVAVVEQAVVQHVAGSNVDIETTMLCLQNYRTEGGRGGTR
jgi:hypothetical protein